MRVPVGKMLSRLASDWMTIALAMSIAITATIVMPTASAVAPIREADSDEQSTPQANEPTYWETDDAECVKFESDPNGGAWGTEWIANGNYSLVVIKSAQTNGTFNGAQAGERLGSPSFNDTNQRQGISHIIACYDLVCETTGGSAPAVNHSVIVFGGLGEPSYESYNKTFGSHSPENRGGIAVDGDAVFHPSASSSWNGLSVITGSASGTGGPSNPSSGPFPYSQQAWIDYAAALADAAEADPSAYPKVRVYRPEGGTRTITLDGSDVPSADAQTLHVVVGPGTLNMPNEKVDGAIIAPEATVLVDKSVQHFHGFVVAARFNDTTNDNGLQIHGQIPDALVNIPGDETCVPPTTLPPTTVAPIPDGDVTVTFECDAGITFAWENTGDVGLTIKQYRDNVLVYDEPVAESTSHAWDIEHSNLAPGNTAKVELWDGENLIKSAEVTYPGECPIASGSIINISVECESDVRYTVVNDGDLEFDHVYTVNGSGETFGTTIAGDTDNFAISADTLEPGDAVVIELLDPESGEPFATETLTYPEPCWVPPIAADCVGNPTGMLQVINLSPNTDGDHVTTFMKLDPVAGDYVPASEWTTLNWTEMGLDRFILNASAFDKDTGKAYAAIRGLDGEAPVLIQFDDAGNVGFLGLLQWNGYGVIAGYVHDGVYYYNNKGVSSVSGLDGLPVYETYAEAVSAGFVSTVLTSFPRNIADGADYAVMQAADGADWLVWHQHRDGKLYGYPLNSISGPPAVMDIVSGPGVPTEYVGAPFVAPHGLLIGAKWSHGGKIYMSDNNGSGVYVLDSIDPAGRTANVFATAIDQTIATNSNDGFSCGEADVPPTPPTAILSIECVIDDFYNVGAEIYGGSLGVNWRLEKSSGELITEGVVPAWATETPALAASAQFTEGLVLVLMSLDSDTTLDSKPVPAPCFAPVPSASLVLDPECDVDVTGSITNDGETTLYGAIYVNDVLVLPDTEIQIGQKVDFQIPALDLTAGDEIKLLAWDDNEFESARTVVYPEPCPQPVGDLVIECVVNDDYRISGSVTATDAGLAWGLGNRAPFLRLDGGRTGANVTDSFDDVYTLTPGSTVFLREQGAGPDWIAFDTVPEGCPIAPTGDISIKCFEDDLYDVAAEIDGGSVGVKWMIRIKGGGGIVTKGSVPAFDDATIFLPAKQLEQGLVLVLRAPDNGGKLDSVTVPASCFAPVSDALIALDTECDAEAKGSITNTGETTLIGNVHINDEVLPGDIEIAPGETEEFILLAELLEEGDVVKLVASGPEDYEREQALTYPEPCPTTTTVPPTTTVVIETPTTVPTTTTTVPETTTTVPETTTTVPDTTTTTPDGGGTVAETPSAEPVEQTPTFTG